MKFLVLLAMVATLPSCGKKKSGKNPCMSRYQKVMECFQAYNETHNRYYVERVCGEKYPEEGCYQ